MDALQKINELRRALNDFREHGDALKKSFADLQNFFDADSFASPETFGNFNRDFASWTDESDKCRRLWAEIFDVPLPKTPAEVESALLAEEKRLVAESVFGRAEKFILFTSTDTRLESILASHQRKLKTLLSRKTRDVKNKDTVELYAKFVDAFNDSDVIKKYSASKELSEFFGDEFIGAGLFGNALTVSAQGNLNFVPVKSKVVDTQTVDDTPVELKTDDTQAVNFAEILRDKGALLTDDDLSPWTEKFSVDREPTRKIDVRHVKEDFSAKRSSAEKIHVIHAAVTEPCISPATLDLFNVFTEKNLSNAVELLRNQGYLKRYTLSGYGEFYGVSKNFFDFLKVDNGKTLLKAIPNAEAKKLYWPKNFDDVELLEDRLQIALPREIYIRLRALADKRKVSVIGHQFLAESFFAVFEVAGKFDLFVACFWTATDEAEKFLRELTDYVNGHKIDRVIVAGLDMSHAAKIFDALDEVLTLPEAEQFTFAFDEDVFCRRGTTEKFPFAELWPTVDEPSPVEKPPVDTKPEKSPETNDDKTTVTDTKPDDLTLVNEMFDAKKFYCATAYLKALSLRDENFVSLYRQLAAAVNDPLFRMIYSADEIISLINDSATLDETFLTAATLRAFFSNDKPSDYDMKKLHETVKNFAPVVNNARLSDLIYELMNFKDAVHKGADFYADYRVKDRQQAETKIAQLRRDAQNCLARFKKRKDNVHNRFFVAATKILFGDDSELASYLEFVAEDAFNADISEEIKAYLTASFMKDNAPLNVANVDNFKLDEIIQNVWKSAGGKGKMTGELKSHTDTTFKKAIEILCERVNIFDETAPLDSDAGAAEYKKVRDKLIANAKAAQKTLSREHVAANEVLIATLQEIVDKLYGNFKPDRQKYFYADFLRGTEILLDENFLPILTFNTLDGSNEGVTERIVVHARTKKLPTFEKRLENIFASTNEDWDFGTAQLIDAYLADTEGFSLIEKRKFKLQTGIDSVKRNGAPNAKKKFFSSVELAQSYGQLDNAPLDYKETILRRIDDCLEFADKTGNYGVFFRIVKYLSDKIRTDAAEYAAIVEENLQLGIDNYCHKMKELPDSPKLSQTVDRIRDLIERQNYMAAQGLINRLSDGKLYNATQVTGQSYLQHFIENFRDYYTPVSKAGTSFQTLIGKNHRFRADTSKGIKGGELLIDNWLPNGFPTSGDVGTGRIATLLNVLGFNVDEVKLLGAHKKDALNYKVKLHRPRNVQSSNYKHPISAFGSQAQTNGFRVTCLFGTYKADALIERFKELGNADDTLVLLDFALELGQRRLLARRIKAELGITKVFAVVDRVVMMYLVKNYDEAQVNSMLMSLTLPFAACQPYVFNPNVPIPPEIFIGREKEIDEVLDFNGVNLVYGGRQLGKTALLKMACASLDRNENDDRAIFVDVNKCNCAAAALKVGQVLRDKNFFDENFVPTDDWSRLTAAIKKRLTADVPNKIPHFLLALDESDDFIKSCREENLTPILQLIDLQQNPPEGRRFKFVMAGLRDVVRFNGNEALDNNGQFVKLPSLVVKPFDLDEANKLLRVPLRYPGLYFADDKNADSLAIMILETTNYFPGLIQLYCAKLIEALSRADYAGYSETSAPVYKISDSHIQNVLGEESFNAEIKKKILMTLRLGDDKFYHVIAVLMAWRYRNDALPDGYSAEDILHTAKDFGLDKFDKLLPDNVKQVKALLKELCELNILRENVEGRYLFVRQRFLNMIGTPDEIDAEISTAFGELP